MGRGEIFPKLVVSLGQVLTFWSLSGTDNYKKREGVGVHTCEAQAVQTITNDNFWT